MVPDLKDHISGDGPQVLEEPVCGATRIDCGLPGKHGEISCRMESEGKQVESDEDTGERFLAVSKTVLEVVSAPLEHIEGFILNLPACPAAGSQFGDGVG